VALAGARVLVTGAAGFVGRAVVRRLLAEGADPVGVVHRPDEVANVPGPAEVVDLESGGALADVMAGTDLVVHLAARSGGIQFQQAIQDDVLDANHRMTRNVLRAATEAGVRRVFLASSAVIYRTASDDDIREESPLLTPNDRGVSGYAWSKLTDEMLAAWYADQGIEPVIGRFTNIYGPGGSFDESRSTVVHALVRRAAEAPSGSTLTVWGSGRAIRSFLFVEDCSRAVAAILDRGEAGTAYNVDSGIPVSIADLAQAVRDAVDPGLELEFDATKPEGVPRRVLDVGRLRALGFQPATDLANGVAATVEAFRTAGG
jgi:GDP-L-fucose synthase